MDDDTLDDDADLVRAARDALARRDWAAARRDFLAAKAQHGNLLPLVHHNNGK